MASNIKNLLRDTHGFDEKTLKQLYKISLSKDADGLYQAIKELKYMILRDEFDYPEKHPVNNALKKAFYKGGDFYLSLLAQIIKRSPEILDHYEEDKEKRGKDK